MAYEKDEQKDPRTKGENPLVPYAQDYQDFRTFAKGKAIRSPSASAAARSLSGRRGKRAQPRRSGALRPHGRKSPGGKLVRVSLAMAAPVIVLTNNIANQELAKLSKGRNWF